MSYDTNREDLLRVGMEIAKVVMKDDDKTSGDSMGVGTGNQGTVQSVVDLSKLVFEGLGKIADALERKHRSEEYYDLLDRIDSLENKILEVGGNIQQVYDSLSFEQKKPITISAFEMRILAYCFDTEERFNWLQEAVAVYQIHPIIILGCLLARLDIVQENRKEITARQDIRQNTAPSLRIVNKDVNYINYNTIRGCITKDWYGVVFGENNLMYVSPSLEERKELMEELMIMLEEAREMSLEELIKVRKLNSLVSQINCQIVLGNLRALHNALLGAYKDLKLSKN